MPFQHQRTILEGAAQEQVSFSVGEVAVKEVTAKAIGGADPTICCFAPRGLSALYDFYRAEVIITTAREFVRLGDKNHYDPLGTRQSQQTATRIEIASAFELATLLANLVQSEHFSIEDGIKLENEEPKQTFGYLMIATGHWLFHVAQILSK
ncbi:hypothetical protein HGM15179_009654 [Zosterops borbonicus]|uniref:Uncharacterized protein n=1 Tax=Zosterops borbonicus TaxID=364589 RepID=A0A8K1LKL4_9PASS|nr:hypothetical protein HGM15179_009654 [Zosterops borbonicus]